MIMSGDTGCGGGSPVVQNRQQDDMLGPYYRSKALSYLAQGQHDLAEKYCVKAITRDYNSGMHVCMGIVLAYRGDHARAIMNFKEALHSDPCNPWIHVLLGESHAALGEHASAMASHLKALLLNTRIVSAWMGLSASFEAKKELIQALECCEQALGLAPKNAALYRNKGRLLETLRKYELARLSYEMAACLESGNA